MKRGALPIVLCVLLGGCSDAGGGASTRVPELDWQPMALVTVPLEPWEARGTIQVAWSGDLMGVYTRGEGGMPAMAIRDGDALYTSQTGMGWTSWDLASYVEQQGRGFRYLAWDAPALLSDGRVSATPGQVHAGSSFQMHGKDIEAVVAVNHSGTQVTQVVIDTPADPESPFTLTPLLKPFPFDVAIPLSKTPADIEHLNAQARDGHTSILAWIKDYRAKFGSLPQDVSAQGLALQRLNEPWPTNPYDSQPMRNEQASGHFAWNWCSAQDASFHGYGWDGAPLNEDFGLACSASEPVEQEL